MGRKLPPYGRRLVNLRQQGLVPNSGQVAIAVDRWDLVKSTREDAIVLPAGEDPASFDWRMVAGLPVLIVALATSINRVTTLALLVTAAGCTGCVGLILDDTAQGVGEVIALNVYRSHWEELRHAA